MWSRTSLEKLIQEEIKKSEGLLWEWTNPSSPLPEGLREMTRKRLRYRNLFRSMHFALLFAKSLRSQAPISNNILKLGSLCELLQVALDLKKQALLEAETPHDSSDSAPPTLNPDPKLSPSMLHLLSDTLCAVVLEEFSKFNVTQLLGAFSSAIKEIYESELLSLCFRNQLQKPSELTLDAYKALLYQRHASFSGSIAESVARLCAAEEQNIGRLRSYAEKIGTALGLLREIKPFLSQVASLDPEYDRIEEIQGLQKMGALNFLNQYIFSYGKHEEVESLARILSMKDATQSFPLLKRLFESSGALHASLAYVNGLLQGAIAQLGELSNPVARSNLTSLVEPIMRAVSNSVLTESNVAPNSMHWKAPLQATESSL